MGPQIPCDRPPPGLHLRSLMGTLGLTISEFVKRLRKIPSVKKAEVYSFLITFFNLEAQNLPLGYVLLKKTNNQKLVI